MPGTGQHPEIRQPGDPSSGDAAAVNGTGTSYSGTFSSVSHCLSGTGNQIDTSLTLAGGEDCHLAASDTAAIDGGTDVSRELGFFDDIDGERRTGTWDIGADER